MAAPYHQVQHALDTIALQYCKAVYTQAEKPPPSNYAECTYTHMYMHWMMQLEKNYHRILPIQFYTIQNLQ